MKRQITELEPTASAPVPAATPPPAAERHTTVHSRAPDIARYGRDLEDRYVAARDAWTEAMHTASSGRPADMASLAIAQQAYETVAAEREHWLASGRVPIPIQPSTKHNDLEIAVGQELAWRRVLDQRARGGLFRRIRRRLGGNRPEPPQPDR